MCAHVLLNGQDSSICVYVQPCSPGHLKCKFIVLWTTSLQASSPPLLLSLPSPFSPFSFLSLLLSLSSPFSPSSFLFLLLSLPSSFSLSFSPPLSPSSSPLLPLAPSFLENGSVYILQTKLLTAAILPLSRVIKQKSTETIHFLLCIML